MEDNRTEVARFGWFVVIRLIMACDGGECFVVHNEAEKRDVTATIKQSGAEKIAKGLYEDATASEEGKEIPLQKAPSEFKRKRKALPGQRSLIPAPAKPKGGAK